MSVRELSPWLLEKIQNGEAILFLGAGAAAGAKKKDGTSPPSGEELRDMISDKFLGGDAKDKPLNQVAEYAKNESSLMEVQHYIASIFSDLAPAPFHHHIAEFRWHSIVTTNYDLIVQTAYAESQTPLQTASPIVRDGDQFSQCISDPNKVPLLKLHGCITVTNDENLPLILSSEEYAKYRRSRKRLFSHLEDWGREHPIIFCGYDVSDPNIQQILFDLGDASINRPFYVLVRPGLKDFEVRYWQSRRFAVFQGTFEDFLVYLNTQIPYRNRLLASVRNQHSAAINRWVSNGSPTQSLFTYLDNELVHIRKGMPYTSTTPRDFYSGNSQTWGLLDEGLDARRSVTDDLLIEVILERSESLRGPRIFLLKGYAGSGKSVTLRRFALEAANEHDQLIFWLEQQSRIECELFSEIYNLTGERFTVVVDDATRRVEDINTLFKRASQGAIDIDLVLSARTNEWNIVGEELDQKLEREYELKDLSNREVTELLDKLEKHGCLGYLENLTDEDKREFFSLTAERQLLVALHEATSGKPFEEIVFDEYKKIVPSEAQGLYLDVCTLHRFGVAVRAGLVSRISGITMQTFRSELFKPLEHLVHTFYDTSSRDYAYRSRHPLIGDFVFRKVLSEQEDRANQIIRIIGGMNIEYASDAYAFENLVRGKDLADLFSDRALADRIFQAALEGTGNESHLHHQRAVFEINHPGGSTKRALSEVNAAIAADNNSRPSISHTKAMILRKMANEAENRLEKKKLRDDAKDMLERQVKRARSPHPFHTLGQVLLDELKDHVADGGSSLEVKARQGAEERAIYALIREIEKIVYQGLQTFPGESYLLGLDADLKEIMSDLPGAMRAVEAAFEANRGDGYAAARLAKIKKAEGRLEEAKHILRQCIEKNPSNKQVRLEYARTLSEESDVANAEEIIRNLRSAFTDGDTNYEAQFLYARHEYLYGKREAASRVFEALGRARVASGMRNRVRGLVVGDTGEAKTFPGQVVKVSDTYAFVRVPEIGADVFVHETKVDEENWRRLRVSVGVKLKVGFAFRGPAGVDVEVTM